MKTYVHKELVHKCSHAALIVADKKWKPFKYPSTDQWINKMVYTVEHYLAIKRNKVMIHDTIWMTLETLC